MAGDFQSSACSWGGHSWDLINAALVLSPPQTKEGLACLHFFLKTKAHLSALSAWGYSGPSSFYEDEVRWFLSLPMETFLRAGPRCGCAPGRPCSHGCVTVTPQERPGQGYVCNAKEAQGSGVLTPLCLGGLRRGRRRWTLSRAWWGSRGQRLGRARAVAWRGVVGVESKGKAVRGRLQLGHVGLPGIIRVVPGVLSGEMPWVPWTRLLMQKWDRPSGVL
jgi:hypothetical protein